MVEEKVKQEIIDKVINKLVSTNSILYDKFRFHCNSYGNSYDWIPYSLENYCGIKLIAELYTEKIKFLIINKDVKLVDKVIDSAVEDIMYYFK